MHLVAECVMTTASQSARHVLDDTAAQINYLCQQRRHINGREPGLSAPSAHP